MSDRTPEWNAKVEAVKDRYADRIVKVLADIGQSLREAGYNAEAEPMFMDGDDYSWSLLVRRVSADGDELDNSDVDITLKICESTEYDGSDEGITFALDIVEIGGRIIGGMSPFNYTPEVWVSLDDEAGIEERFSYFEEADPADVAELLDSHPAESTP